MRWFFSWFAAGALIGAVIATLIAPMVLEALLASTGAKDAMCQCTELVANTASLLIRTQLWGAGVGSLVFPLAAFLVRRKRPAKIEPPAQPVA